MAADGNEFVIRLTGKSDGATKAVNAVSSAAGRLVTVLSNLARQAHMLLPALTLKTAALGLLADSFRRVRNAAIESFEPVEAGLIKLQQTTTMSARSISASMQHMFTIASSTGTQMESVIAAMGAAARGGETGYGTALAAQAGTSMSLIMGGQAADWAATGAAGGQQFGMSTEDYLDRLLWGHQRGMDQAAVDAQLEAGVNLNQAAGALSQAANLLAGSRAFEEQRADNEWDLMKQQWGAAFDTWGFGGARMAQMKRWGVKNLLREPARELYNADMWIREHGVLKGLWGGFMSGFESPYPDSEHVAMDGSSGAGTYYSRPKDVVVGVGGLDREYRELAKRQTYLVGYEGDLTAAQEAEIGEIQERLKAISAEKQAIKDRKATSALRQEAYVKNILGGVEGSDRRKLADAVRATGLQAQVMAEAQARAALETEQMAQQMSLARLQATNMASGMASAARLVGQQADLAAFGVMGQLNQLHQQYGEYLPAILTVMKHKTGGGIIDMVKGMVQRTYGAGVANLIDWDQFVTPTAPTGPTAVTPAAVPTLYAIGGGRSPAYSAERIEAEANTVRAAGGTLLDLPAG